MLADLLFLHRFYFDPDPWANLRSIEASVLEDFAPARRLGHTLLLAPFSRARSSRRTGSATAGGNAL
jgi:hypothetical protein